MTHHRTNENPKKTVNQPAILLSKSDNELLFDIIGQKCIVSRQYSKWVYPYYSSVSVYSADFTKTFLFENKN